MPRFITFTVALLAFVISCPPPSIAGNGPTTHTKAGIFLGEVKHMGNGVVWSWVISDSEGHPTSLGITFTETALSGLPENPPSDVPYVDYELSIPQQTKVAPYNHIVVDWNPHGHIPPGIYDIPHFDFHFYMITSRERNRITAKGDDIARLNKKPPAQYVPAGYILPEGTQEPRMGSHWVDPSSPEFNKQPFTKTFIYGSYNGEITFLEPMVSKAFLETRPKTTETIKLPNAYKKHGYYPTAYSVSYDPLRKEYTVSLQGLTYR